MITPPGFAVQVVVDEKCDLRLRAIARNRKFMTR